MDTLIPVVSKLGEVLEAVGPAGADVAVDLPCIVVVGCQSSGKSSVLEAIVQRDFLPRGRDIVTRRPLVLQLVHVATAIGSSAEFAHSAGNAPSLNASMASALSASLSSSSDASLTLSTQPQASEEWAEFGHLPGRRFTDFFAIRREIEEETARVAGTNGGISRLPIHLRIHSPHVLPLTLVDLPGITKIPVGEQPPDIEAVVRALVLEYASRPNAIILAVTPANADLANSDALKIAREADPSGTRTLGVLTKLDLMDAGTHAADVLAGRSAFRLRLGFVGVVCRSQHDINVGKPIRDALRHEAEFFRAHAHYRSIAHRCGASFLARELNRILLRAIREQLPGLRTRVNALVLAAQAELAALGEPLPPAGAARAAATGGCVLRLLTLYVADFGEALQGTSRSSLPETTDASLDTDTETSGGARIAHVFSEVYAEAVAKVDATAGLSPADVRAAIRHASGPRPALFVPEASFEALARRQIARLAGPAQQCADLVYAELGRMLHRAAERRAELRRFPALAAKVVSVAAELLRERLRPTLDMIDALVHIEMAYINTRHPDFCRASAPLGVLARIVEAQRVSALSLSETADAEPLAAHHAEDIKAHGGLLSYLFRSPPQSPPAVPSPAPPKRRTSDHPPDISQAAKHVPGPKPHTDDLEAELIMTLLQTYMAIVRKNIADSVPKAVMHLMVNALAEQLPTRLVTELYREELFADLLVEDDAVVRQRVRARTALDAYRDAGAILADLSASSGSLSP